MKKNFKEKKDQKPFDWRMYTLVIFVLVIIMIICCRLYFLQIKDFNKYSALAYGQHMSEIKIVPRRGEVFIKDGDGYYPVAVNKEMNLIFAVPREVENPDEVASKLASLIEIDLDEVRGKLADSSGWYAVIAHKVNEQKTDEVRNLKIKGIYDTPEDERYYPAGNFLSHTIGFIGSDGNDVKGRYGIEAYWEPELRGVEGLVLEEKDTKGRWISVGKREIVNSQSGLDLYLTIDHTIQYRAEMAIKKAVERHRAQKGSIIILNPENNAVLAMASYPDYNPNEFSQVEDMSIFANPAISDAYECGSVFKAITMAAAIDTKAVSAETTYFDTGSVSEAGYTIKNSDGKSYGLQTMAQVLERSLNTGAIFAEKQMGNNLFYQYVKSFGFGEKTGIDTSYETTGNISSLEKLKNINAYTASFGQGITVTPIQLAQAFSAIANGGKLIRPKLVEKTVDDSGNEKIIQSEEKRRVLDQETSRELARMLVSVVKNGHGKLAGVPGYLVAGKTGTAQVPKKEGLGYDENVHIGSFVGFAPAYDPKFVMVVRIDLPQDVEWAESSAAPVFGEMAKFLFDYLGIEPTEPYTQKDVEKFNATHDLSVYESYKPEEKNIDETVKNENGSSQKTKGDKKSRKK